MKRLTVQPEDSKKRLDVFVTEQYTNLSRSSVQKLCRQGKITVNDKSYKSNYKLREGDKIDVDYDADINQAQHVDLPVLYEDDDCIVVNKPIGILTHSKGAFNPEPTVATWLLRHLKKQIIPQNPLLQEPSLRHRYGIVHRLDRATSGVMICAKSPEALSWLQKQFSTRKVKKTYIAIVAGKIEPREAIIDMPIERNPKKPQTFRVGANGKPAITAYRVIESNQEYSLVELLPQTGRTHQLRVHMNHIKHPIVGDILYGGQAAERLYLHALSLEVSLPNHTKQSFTSPLPPEFSTLMADL